MSFAVSARPATVTDHPRVMLVIPPSITISCPLTNPDPSLARKTAACAISSGSPARGIGWIVAKRSFTTPVNRSALEPSRPAFFPKIPVTIAPGEMQLTRIPFSPSSAAAERVNALTAPFEAL